MSKLYMTAKADNRKEVTRRGHRRIQAHVRGWNHGVRLDVYLDNDDNVVCDVVQTGGSNATGREKLLLRAVENDPVIRVNSGVRFRQESL